MSLSKRRNITWLAKKDINYDRFTFHLKKSSVTGQYTNYGPAVRALEEFFSLKLGIDKETHSVIATANGTSAMHALISAICRYEKIEKPKIKTQAFTFPSSAQYGHSSITEVHDVDATGVLAQKSVDGGEDIAIITSIFGCVGNILEYKEHCSKLSTLLLLDNAAAPLSTILINNKKVNSCLLADGAIISLHHTKLLGFGEGGLVVVKRQYEPLVREMINFGFAKDGKRTWKKQASNWRMSDISAAAILQYAERFFSNIDALSKIQDYFISRLPTELEIYPTYEFSNSIFSCFPILYPNAVSISDFEGSGIEVKKYYSPLEPLPTSSDFFNRIICLPSHSDLSKKDVDYMLGFLRQVLERISTRAK